MAEPQNTTQYVSERRSIVADAICEIAGNDAISKAQLTKLQEEVEDIRVMNPSPLDRIRILVALLEDRVVLLESMLSRPKLEKSVTQSVKPD